MYLFFVSFRGLKNKLVIFFCCKSIYMNKVITCVLCVFCLSLTAQNKKTRFHSHNDYNQNIPFWNAYSQKMNSIEIDLVLSNDSLFVCHDIEDNVVNRTIENLYLEPLKKANQMNFSGLEDLQFLVDLKSEAIPSLDLLIPILESYKDVINANNIVFVISGNKPDLAYFSNFPSYVKMDLQVQDSKVQDPSLWDKVAMVSYNFKNIFSWNGQGEIPKTDKIKLKKLIDQAHLVNKPIRFWATPDTVDAWRELSLLDVDFINTDLPAELRIFFDQKTI